MIVIDLLHSYLSTYANEVFILKAKNFLFEFAFNSPQGLESLTPLILDYIIETKKLSFIYKMIIMNFSIIAYSIK